MSSTCEHDDKDTKEAIKEPSKEQQPDKAKEKPKSHVDSENEPKVDERLVLTLYLSHSIFS